MSKTSPRSSKAPAASSEFGIEADGSPLASRGIETSDPAEVARYVGEFTLELSSLAKRSRLDFLAYLLDMARIEAERLTKRQ